VPSLILLVLPIFMVVFLGKYLRLTLVKSPEAWEAINRIAYWVLFPAFLFVEISKLDLGSPNLLTYSLALVAGFFGALAFAYAAGRLASVPNPALTSIVQGAVRHNTFIGLAVTTQVLGPAAAPIGTVATASLVPLSNVAVVVLLAAMLNRGAGPRRIAGEILRNPIILAIAGGLVFSRLGLERDFILYQFAEMLGRATVPMLLLVIGANLRTDGLRGDVLPVAVSVAGKMLVFPAVTLLACRLAGVSTEMTVIAMIFASCPTSPAGFPLAAQMGGDAPLMATIISVQTALAVIAIPLAIVVARALA
jgi:malonate transporter and related proteins